MVDDDETKIKSDIEELKARLEAVQMTNTDLARSLIDASRTIAELRAEINLLKEDKGDTDEDEADTEDESKELAQITSAAAEVEDQQVIEPDAHAFTGDATRKSIEWAPEMANIPQLNEFDDAPSVGCVKVMAKGGRLVLVDPDEQTGSRKWMIPLRRDDTTKELKWALIGDDSDSSDSSDSDSESEPSGEWLTVLTGVSVSGNSLMFSTASVKAVYVNGQTITITGTTCESGGSA